MAATPATPELQTFTPRASHQIVQGTVVPADSHAYPLIAYLLIVLLRKYRPVVASYSDVPGYDTPMFHTVL